MSKSVPLKEVLSIFRGVDSESGFAYHVNGFCTPATEEGVIMGLTITDRTGIDKAIFNLLVVFAACSAFSIALTQIGYFSALILWVGRMVYTKKFAWPRTPLDAFFLAYVGVEVLATIFSIDPLYSLLYLQRRMLLLPIAYVLIGNITSANDAKIIFAAIIVSAVGVALYSLIPLVEHFSDYLLFKRRLGEFQIYMTAGGIQMITLLLLLPFLVHKSAPRKVRLIVGMCLIPLLINLLFTFTRSAWLGFMVGIIVIGAYRTPRIIVALAVLVALVYIFSTPEMRYNRFQSLVDPNHPQNVSRLHMWRTGWRSFKDYPILGIGDIGSETIWDKYAEPGWGPEGHLHNNVMMWLLTLGSVGVVVLIAFFVKAWIVVACAEKKLREDWFGGSLALGGLAVFAGFHIAGLFEWNFGDTEISMLIWAMLGLVLATQRVADAAPVVQAS